MARSFKEALDVELYGVDNQRILQETKVPGLLLPTVDSPDQNLAIEFRNEHFVSPPDEDVVFMDIPFSFLLTPVLRKLIAT